MNFLLLISPQRYACIDYSRCCSRLELRLRANVVRIGAWTATCTYCNSITVFVYSWLHVFVLFCDPLFPYLFYILYMVYQYRIFSKLPWVLLFQVCVCMLEYYMVYIYHVHGYVVSSQPCTAAGTIYKIMHKVLLKKLFLGTLGVDGYGHFVGQWPWSCIR